LLPFKIGARFKTVSNGKEYIDVLDHYIIKDEIFVVLDLGGVLSVPIPINDFVSKWTPHS